MKRAILVVLTLFCTIASYAQTLTYSTLNSVYSKRDLPTIKPLEYRAVDGNIYAVGQEVEVMQCASYNSVMPLVILRREERPIEGTYTILRFLVGGNSSTGFRLYAEMRNDVEMLYTLNFDEAIMNHELKAVNGQPYSPSLQNSVVNDAVDIANQKMSTTANGDELTFDNILSAPIGDYTSYVSSDGVKIIVGETTVVVGTTFNSRFTYISCSLSASGCSGKVNSITLTGKGKRKKVVMSVTLDNGATIAIHSVEDALFEGEIYVKRM